MKNSVIFPLAALCSILLFITASKSPKIGLFHQTKTVLTPARVEASVAEMRRKSVKFRDTVPAPVPALVSPCDF